MATHYHLGHLDSYSTPPGHVHVILKTVKYMGRFGAVYHHAQQKAIKDAKAASAVLVWLETLVMKDNILAINAAKISKDMGISKPTFYQHLSTLRDLQLIIPHEDEEGKANPTNWRICPFLGWASNGRKMVEYVCALPSEHPFLRYMDPTARSTILKTLREAVESGELEQVEGYDPVAWFGEV